MRKKLLPVLLLALGVGGGEAAPTEKTNHAVRVALIDFTSDDNTYSSAMAAKDFTALLQSQLGTDAEWEWVEREQLRLAEQELHLATLNLMAGSDAIKRGKWVNAEWLVLGRFAFDTQGEHGLELELVDLRHADLLAEKTIPWAENSRGTPTFAQLKTASDSLRDMLAAGKRRAARNSKQVVITPLFFSDLSGQMTRWGQDLRVLETEFHDYLEVLAATNQNLRVVRVPRAHQSIDEAALIASGMAETTEEGWQQLSDLYLWGSCTMTNPMPNTGRFYRTNPPTLIRLTLNAWNGQDQPATFTQRLTVTSFGGAALRDITARFNRMLENAIKNAQPVMRTNDTALIRKQIAVSLLADVNAMASAQRHGLGEFIITDEDRRRFADAVRMLEAACFFEPENAVAHALRVTTRWGDWMKFQHSDKGTFWAQWRRSEEWAKYVDRFGLKPVIKLSHFDEFRGGMSTRYQESLGSVLGMFGVANKEQAYGFPAGVPREMQSSWKAQLEAEAVRRKKICDEYLREHGNESRSWPRPAATNRASANIRNPPAGSRGAKPETPMAKPPVSAAPKAPALNTNWVKKIPAMFQQSGPRILPPELKGYAEPVLFPARSEVSVVRQMVTLNGQLWVVAEDEKVNGINAPNPDVKVEMEAEASRLWRCGSDATKLELVNMKGLPETIRSICVQGPALWVAGDRVSRYLPQTGSVEKFGPRDGLHLSEIETVAAAGERVVVAGGFFKMFTHTAGAKAWEEMPIQTSGGMSKSSGQPFKACVQGENILLLSGNMRLGSLTTGSWTNLGDSPWSQAAAADETGFWIGGYEGVDIIEFKQRALRRWQPGSYYIWNAPALLTSPNSASWRMQAAYGQIPPREVVEKVGGDIRTAFKQFAKQRAQAHETRAKQGRTTDPLELPTRLSGRISALAHDGEFLWLGTESGMVLLFHKPSRSWVGRIMLNGRLTSLAVSDNHLWMGSGYRNNGEPLVHRLNKKNLLSTPRSEWMPDAVTEAELEPLIQNLPARSRALHAFFTGDYATCAHLLEDNAKGALDLEALFLLAFSCDALGLDKPDAARRYFEEIIATHPETPWAEVARDVLNENNMLHQKRELQRWALVQFDRNGDGVLDESEKRALAKDVEYQKKEQALAGQELSVEMEQVVKRYDYDADKKLDLTELTQLRSSINSYLTARKEMPQVKPRSKLLEPLISDRVPAVPEMLKRYDANRDEKLDAGELTVLANELQKK